MLLRKQRTTLGKDVGTQTCVSPPSVGEQICLGDVNAKDEGQAVAVIDSPGEDPVGQAPGGWREEVGDDVACNGPADSLACANVTDKMSVLFHKQVKKVNRDLFENRNCGYLFYSIICYTLRSNMTEQSVTYSVISPEE